MISNIRETETERQRDRQTQREQRQRDCSLLQVPRVNGMSVSISPASFPKLNSYLWLMTTMLDSTDGEHSHHC